MPKLPTAPKPEEQIRPDALVRTIKNEKAPGNNKLKDIPVTPENYKKFRGETPTGRPHLPRGVVWGLIGLVVFFIIGSLISYAVARREMKKAITLQASTLKAGVADLQNFDTGSAIQQFSELSSSTSTPTLESLLGMFGSFFTGGKNAVSSFGDLANQLTNLSQEANGLGDGILAFATGSSTQPGLAVQLQQIRTSLGAIDADSNDLSGSLSELGASSTIGGTDFYLPLKAKIGSVESFLDTFIPWLANPTPHHILVLLQNPSEMRPGGGFLGSYADVTIASGSITDIAVHDVADVDAGFPLKVVPPAPLQLEVTGFRPADANWFLDFPTSASETIHYFEASALYGASSTASSTQFDAAIAISPNVVSDLLSITGPITISSTSTKPKIPATTFNSDNLLIQIQNIVQAGQAANQSSASGEATYPKAVLGQLSQAIFTNLASSTDAQKQELFSMALDWIAKRDVMAYFANPSLEQFVESNNAGGDIYQLPQNFNGDYLSMADANIRGDKSDLYMEQSVSLDAQIGADGTITDTLKIKRMDNGNQSPYWWYQTTNQDYLQVFTPFGSALTNESGGVTKKITAPINYATAGYSTDPLIEAIVSSTQSFLLYPAVTEHTESGKTVFATWAITPKGKSTSLEFDYTHPAFTPPAEGVQYQFVFDKQPGSDRSYDLEVDAPLGYVFKENGLASYEFISDDPPGRLITNLTLQKLQ